MTTERLVLFKDFARECDELDDDELCTHPDGDICISSECPHVLLLADLKKIKEMDTELYNELKEGFADQHEEVGDNLLLCNYGSDWVLVEAG